MRSVVFARLAKKDQRSIPVERREQIADHIRLLAQGERGALDIVAVEGHAPWQRLRVGSYRVIFRMTADTVEIARVVTRQELLGAVRRIGR